MIGYGWCSNNNQIEYVNGEIIYEMNHILNRGYEVKYAMILAVMDHSLLDLNTLRWRFQ